MTIEFKKYCLEKIIGLLTVNGIRVTMCESLPERRYIRSELLNTDYTVYEEFRYKDWDILHNLVTRTHMKWILENMDKYKEVYMHFDVKRAGVKDYTFLLKYGVL